MSTEDKAKNLADKAGASVKEAAGKVTGDESMQQEGRAEKAKADLKQTGEKVKDTLRDVSD
ncbi:MAG TPA: CsbD family protein [Candidatus Angelobacter sp.]|nr:CsbD family protein [Candidatus Angelobacter sp.]